VVWTNEHSNISSAKYKVTFMSKWFKRVGVGVLVASVVFLLYVDVKQAQVIQAQRHLIVEMYQFIVAGCPVSQLN